MNFSIYFFSPIDLGSLTFSYSFLVWLWLCLIHYAMKLKTMGHGGFGHGDW
jgi:hypothetical protein